MALIRRGKKWYFVKRVPKEFASFDTRKIVQTSLKTDSESEALRLVVDVEAALQNYWVALSMGSTDTERYKALVAVAAQKGHAYRPLKEIYQSGGVEDLLERLGSLSDDEVLDGVSLDAVAGKDKRPSVQLSALPEMFFDVEKTATLGKSADQLRRWKNPRIKAFANLVKVVGNKDLNKISRDDALRFRDWWQNKILRDNVSANSANKDLSYINSTLKLVIDRERLEIENPFSGLKFKEIKKHRPPFSPAWVQKHFTVEGLAGLNAQARDIFLAMINTGCRPSEICGLHADDIKLSADIPHIIIRGNALRALKTHSSERLVPLCGISLEAMHRNPNGFPNYAGRDKFSDTVNKFLRSNDLLETDGHSAYSLRHSFEDRMLALNVPDRLAADLMGHAVKRERYGAGPSLAQLADVVRRLSF